MGVVWVHWLMARGQILKDSLFLPCTPTFGYARKDRDFYRTLNI